MKLRFLALALLVVSTAVLSGCKGGPKTPPYATATAAPYPGYP